MSTKKSVICLIISFIILICCVQSIIYIMFYTHGLYEINISAECITNNSVGRDWRKTYVMDGKYISSGELVTAPLDTTTTKTITTFLTEIDEYCDFAEDNISITLKDDAKAKRLITVYEDNGRFKGNRAEWLVTVSVKFIKRIRPEKENSYRLQKSCVENFHTAF